MIALNGLLGKAEQCALRLTLWVKAPARVTGLCLTSRGLAAAPVEGIASGLIRLFHASDPSGAQALQDPLDPVDAA
jgi:hypothetical protein